MSAFYMQEFMGGNTYKNKDLPHPQKRILYREYPVWRDYRDPDADSLFPCCTLRTHKPENTIQIS